MKNLLRQIIDKPMNPIDKIVVLFYKINFRTFVYLICSLYISLSIIVQINFYFVSMFNLLDLLLRLIIGNEKKILIAMYYYINIIEITDIYKWHNFVIRKYKYKNEINFIFLSYYFLCI